MNKYSVGLVAAIVLFSPAGLWACDCGCDDIPPSRYFHFKDGIAPNGPVDTAYGRGDTEGYSASFSFHDYGPAHVPPPPVEMPPPKRPSS